jgi:hypothetical protein
LGESKFDSWWKQTYIATELWNTRLLSPGTGRLKNKQTNKKIYYSFEAYGGWHRIQQAIMKWQQFDNN